MCGSPWGVAEPRRDPPERQQTSGSPSCLSLCHSFPGLHGRSSILDACRVRIGPELEQLAECSRKGKDSVASFQDPRPHFVLAPEPQKLCTATGGRAQHPVLWPPYNMPIGLSHIGCACSQKSNLAPAPAFQARQA